MSSKTKSYLQRCTFLIPSVLLFIIFVIYPFVGGIYYSFTQWDGLSAPMFTGFENYKRMFCDSSFLAALKNTLIFCAAIMLVGNLVALLLAILLNRPMKGVGFLRTVYYLPAVLSLMVVSIVWGTILGYNGALNDILKILGMGGIVRDWISDFTFALPTLILITIWGGTGYSAVIYLAGLQSIPKELYESGAVDGVNAWEKFRYITLPMLMPSITVVTFLCLSGGLKIFDLPYLMTHGGPGNATVTLAMKVYTLAFTDMNYGYATAASIVLFVLTMAASILQIYITRSKETEV